jgi:hypothetical protein
MQEKAYSKLMLKRKPTSIHFSFCKVKALLEFPIFDFFKNPFPFACDMFLNLHQAMKSKKERGSIIIALKVHQQPQVKS